MIRSSEVRFPSPAQRADMLYLIYLESSDFKVRTDWQNRFWEIPGLSFASMKRIYMHNIRHQPGHAELSNAAGMRL